MPIIILGSVPPNSGRWLAFAFLSMFLLILVPICGCVLLVVYVNRLLGYMWAALSLALLIYGVARVDRQVVWLLKWQIEQYSKPVWEDMDDLPEAGSLFDKIAAFLVH